MDQAEQLRIIKANNQIRPTARVITVTSGKGGVGKSNMSINLAIQFRKMGKRVIILDADFGLANIEIMFGAIPKHNLCDLVYEGKSISDIITWGPMEVGFISGGSGIAGMSNLGKDGPETVLRKMKEKNLYVLPVVDGNRQFLGEVRLKDVLALRKAGNHDLSSIVMKEVPSVLENTTVEDMLPLLPEIRQALPVVNEANQLAGLVSTSSIIIEMTGKDKEEIDQIVQNAIEL